MLEMKYDCLLLGGDLRQKYMKEYLEKSGFRVFSLESGKLEAQEYLPKKRTLEDIFSKSKVIILPVPSTKDGEYIFSFEGEKSFTISNIISNLQNHHIIFGGCLTKEMIKECEKKGTRYYDFMSSKDVAWLNGIATAEGAIAKAVVHSEVNIHQSKVLVLGYGKCGKILAGKLKAMDAYVTIGAKARDMGEAVSFGHKAVDILDIKDIIADFEFIFNTIPAVILNKELLSSISPETTIIDIASSPGGLDYEFAKERNMNAHLYLGIPGKVSPKTSGRILGEEIQSVLAGTG